MIPYGKQEITQCDIKAVVDVLQSPFITQGPQVKAFESAIANKVNAKYASAFNSATSALHCAVLALGLRKNDYLWTSPISFVASSNCALYCKAKVDFVDINPKTYNMDVDLLEAKLRNSKKNKLPKVLVAVHFGGQSCDMERIFALSREFDFKIIEDASHALGGKYKGFRIGSCKFSDISIFSFHPVKIITSAEGGIATTNSEKYHHKMELLKSHGITKNKKDFYKKSNAPWYYEEQILGYNYRLSELHAALGLSQLERLEQYVAKRNALAKKYNEALKDLALITPFIEDFNFSAFHLYPIVLKKNCGIKRKALFKEFLKADIYPQVHYIPIHLQPFYQRFGFKKGDFKNAESYYKRAISLPLFPSIREDEQDKVIEILRKLIKDG